MKDLKKPHTLSIIKLLHFQANKSLYFGYTKHNLNCLSLLHLIKMINLHNP
jgi:hypothetical protein